MPYCKGSEREDHQCEGANSGKKCAQCSCETGKAK